MAKASISTFNGNSDLSAPALPEVYPLEPISKAEIETAVSVYQASDEAKAGGKCAFSYVVLVEPMKSEMQQFLRGGPKPPRVLRLVGLDELNDAGFQADVDVSHRSIVQVTRLSSNGQAALTLKDMIRSSKAVKKSPDFIAAIQKRGLDLEEVQVEPWPPGTGITNPAFPDGARIWRCTFFIQKDETDNCYGRPIHGLTCDVDINSGKTIVNDREIVPVPTEHARFDTAHQGPLRTDLKPIVISQPEGVSFEVHGHHVKWAGWEFRVNMHPIQGLVLHDISFHGRSLLYRASLSDMVVPYSDSDPQHNFKHVLDGSEPTISGANTNSLKLGCDCLGEIHYFDMHYLGWDGKTKTVENAICLHEEDAGIQWKTTDMRTKISEVRRGRRLVVSSFSTVGNYDYGWYYHLHLDGEIEVEVKLTGIMSVGAGETADPQFAPLVAPNISAPIHQHLFCFRLDWNLDDGPNRLCEEQVELLPLGADNPGGQIWRVASRVLETESDAKRVIAPEQHRTWKIVNNTKKNSLGKPVAYKVLQGAAPHLLAHDSAMVAQRATFAKYNLWATRYTDGELYAAGQHTVMSDGGAGLPTYTNGNRSIVDCDLVTWHTIGATHIPRPEDWPVMPVEKARLNLIPAGFFDKSPVMNLPPGTHCHSDVKSKL